MPEFLTVVRHPLVQHKLTIMRDRDTSTNSFRRLLREISQLLAYEIIREKLFSRLHEELPYRSTVETEQWKELKDGSTRIEQTIYVEQYTRSGIAVLPRCTRPACLAFAA